MDPRADRGASVLVGAVLPERYEPIRRIARGGMATVWCAQDRTLDRRVAIKLLAEPFAYDELAGRRFKREARAAARLSGHPNVVTIYDVGETPPEEGPRGRPFLVMEYLSGGTVADALHAGYLDRLAALRWLQQAAAALDYAHRRRVIHRDVKPANFLLDRDRILHVADFGIAQLGTEDTLTVSGEVLGTAAYLAPERALGQPATEASDRYALAVAAYELMVGERPFTAEHFAAQARQHLEDAPPLASRRNPDLPPALDAVLERGMAKRPEDRFPTCLQLTDAIEDALAPTSITQPMAVTTRTLPMAQAAAPPRRAAAGGATAGHPAAIPRPTRARVAVLTALAVALLGIAIAAAASGGPGARKAGHSTAGNGARAVASHTARTPKKHGHHPSTTPSTQTSAGSSATTSPPASSPPSGGSTPAGATALEAQGHALMEGGNYSGAIPVLRRAVATAPSSSLTYAYALYDLGRSLRLAGDPRAAVQILWRRLQIPNQTSTVRAELALALQALGQRASSPTGDSSHSHGGGGQGD